MGYKIQTIKALEVLDSRGNPTVRVVLALDDGTTAVATVPSGASTGENEAVELRDGDSRRYGGKGVAGVVANVEEKIAPRLVGQDVRRQAEIDRMMIELDGTPNKSKLGANAILGVSMAAARAAAAEARMPLYTYLGGANAVELPVPQFNVLNGGKHADSSLDLQEFMIVPLGAPSYKEALRYGSETFHAIRDELRRRGVPTSVGDEGGFAPPLESHEAALELMVKGIEAAGYRPGEDIAIALDPAATSFFEKGVYELKRSGQGRKDSGQMIELYRGWVGKYPIVSIEDGVAEDDWDGFRRMTTAFGDKIQIIGDDIFVTNPRFIERGIHEKTANAALIKLNQIGTVTETVDAVKLCRKAGWGYVMSHRSGETEDTFLADFTVAMGGGQLKTGSTCRGERVAKYNRLLEIEQELGCEAFYPGAGVFGRGRKGAT